MNAKRGLATLLVAHFERTGDPRSLNAAVKLEEDVLNRIPDTSAEWPVQQHDLAIALHRRFEARYRHPLDAAADPTLR